MTKDQRLKARAQKEHDRVADECLASGMSPKDATMKGLAAELAVLMTSNPK